MATIWVVDDDPQVQAMVALVLAEDGHRVVRFGRGEDVIEEARESAPDMVILDIGLPDGDGLRVCQALRGSPSLEPIPVLVITGSSRAEDRYRTFQFGADDFLTKPFDSFELLLRVRNRLKRARLSTPEAPEVLLVADLSLDLTRHDASVAGRCVHLTSSEFQVLRYLMERPGKPIDTETLMTRALGYPAGLATHQVLRTHVRNLRTKLEIDPSSPRRLVNLPGVGYLVMGPSH